MIFVQEEIIQSTFDNMTGNGNTSTYATSGGGRHQVAVSGLGVVAVVLALGPGYLFDYETIDYVK